MDIAYLMIWASRQFQFTSFFVKFLEGFCSDQIGSCSKLKSILITAEVGCIQFIHLNPLRLLSRWNFADGGYRQWAMGPRHTIRFSRIQFFSYRNWIKKFIEKIACTHEHHIKWKKPSWRTYLSLNKIFINTVQAFITVQNKAMPNSSQGLINFTFSKIHKQLSKIGHMMEAEWALC